MRRLTRWTARAIVPRQDPDGHRQGRADHPGLRVSRGITRFASPGKHQKEDFSATPVAIKRYCKYLLVPL
jgi:hypothetical protein